MNKTRNSGIEIIKICKYLEIMCSLYAPHSFELMMTEFLKKNCKLF